jgi:4'-phosphopantetheinyl transferase
LKEALAKGVGMGLHLPFPELEFELEPSPRVRAVPAEAAGTWWLAQCITGDGHVESLALRIDSDSAIELSHKEWVGSGSTARYVRSLVALRATGCASCANGLVL